MSYRGRAVEMADYAQPIVDDAVKCAVLAERERCAKIAEGWSARKGTTLDLQAEFIAEDIRKGEANAK